MLRLLSFIKQHTFTSLWRSLLFYSPSFTRFLWRAVIIVNLFWIWWRLLIKLHERIIFVLFLPEYIWLFQFIIMLLCIIQIILDDLFWRMCFKLILFIIIIIRQNILWLIKFVGRISLHSVLKKMIIIALFNILHVPCISFFLLDYVRKNIFILFLKFFQFVLEFQASLLLFLWKVKFFHSWFIKLVKRCILELISHQIFLPINCYLAHVDHRLIPNFWRTLRRR